MAHGPILEEGKKIDSATMPTGGRGIVGWLSAVWYAITSGLFGSTAHDASASSTKPLLTGGYASAAAPADVSADTDAVRSWHLLNGSYVCQISAAGALIPGDATNGLDVDVIRLPSGTVAGGTSLPAGTNNIGDVDVLTLPALPAGTNNIGDVDVLTLPAIPAGTNNIGDVDVLTVPADPFGANADSASATGSISAKLRYLCSTGIVVNTNAFPVSSTATTTSVNDNNANTTILSSNASRKGATIYNDSTAYLYLKLGTTASTTSFTCKLSPDGYYEVPFGYTGDIDGIWSANASGAARICELT